MLLNEFRLNFIYKYLARVLLTNFDLCYFYFIEFALLVKKNTSNEIKN